MILLEKFNLKTHFVTTLIGNHSKFRIKTNQKKITKYHEILASCKLCWVFNFVEV